MLYVWRRVYASPKMQQHSSKGSTAMIRRQLNGPAILYWMLIGLVLFAYAAPIYIVITQFLPFHDKRSLWFLNVLALVLLFLTMKPVWRWIQPRVHDIVYGIDAPNIEVIGKISDALAYSTLDAVQLAT